MPTRLFYDSDCSLEVLEGKTIAFIGYGNQGRAQALNLRDTLKEAHLATPPTIVVANRDDAYASTAAEDGFGSSADWSKIAQQADVLFLLVPDQVSHGLGEAKAIEVALMSSRSDTLEKVQPKLFNDAIAPFIKKSCCLVIASGYNVFYKYLNTGPSNDIVMVAPRMIGTSVRSRFVSGQGYPCFVSVEQNGTGNAWPLALALCRAVGATKGGVIESSCREETLMDLFAEQALYPVIIATFREGYRQLRSLGCSDEALVHEMWLSKEPAEIFEKAADDGFIRQLVHHSMVSQYGQLKGSLEMDTSWLQKEFKRVSEERILGGAFAKEFTALEEDSEGGVERKLAELYDKANQSELAVGEKKVRTRLGMST